MKLNSAMVERTLKQFQGEAIPDDHPIVAQLSDVFGEHTFFLDSNGLNIVEPTEPTQAGAQTARIVNVASWGDESRTTLAPHEPEPTDAHIELGTMH